MKMRKMMKRGISLLLALVMILGYLPAAVPHVHAASNLEGGLEGQEADVFSALGFDTTVEPEGYDANTTDNPYGREKLTGNQIFEMVIGSSSGMKRAGYDNNGVSVSGTVGSLSGTKMPLDVFGGAAGDFDGDGLPGEIIYVGIPNFDLSNSGCAYLPVRMYLYDGKSGSFSGNRDIATLNKIAYEEREFNYGGYEGDPVLTRVTKLYDLDLYGYTEVTAGDYDGDGYSEIAVYVPETGNARIDVYKWMRDENSTADSWKDWSNWSVIWSRPISGTDYVPNMVSLVSSDINRDGIDDLGIAYSGLQKNQNNWGVVSWSIGQNSQAAILWGSRNNALQNNTSLSLCEGELGTQFRTSLNVGDINGDGYQELVVTGQPTTDFRSNTTRSIIVYTYDGVGGMAALYKGNQKVVDGAYEMVTKYDEEGNPYEVEEWVSNNGFDANYLSQPYLRTNAAVLKLEGYDYNYLYLDSCIYEFIEGSLTLKMCLDDASYDGNNTLNATWLSSEPYMEYGAAAADLNGNSYDQLYSSFLSWVDPVDATLYSTLTPLDDPATPDVDESKENDPQFNYWEIRSGGYSGLQGNGSGALSAKTHSQKTDIKEFDPDKMANYGPQDLPHYLAIPADVDLDTTIVEYTGIHYLTYSDPEVLAVIAAAPYFEDVDIISDYDYAWQNTTSWTTTEGEGHGTLVTVDLEAGAFYSSTKVVSSFLTSLETSVNFTLEWEESSTSTTEYSLTFETSQDEDAVAFFSIPMEHYVYMVYRPDKDGNYVSEQQIISNQFQPVYQVLNLDYYESIRKDYEDQLPAIAGKVLTSTPGDPGSYPSSTAGYDVISQWNKDAAGVSFGNGAITQEITVTQEEAEMYNLGCAMDFQLGFGGKAGVALGSVTEFEAQGGIQFSLNPGGGWTDMTMTGTTISGTVTNMPLEFQDYGYYYNWKIFSYAHKFGNSTIPVISYIVNDVQEPPKLPADFQQDVQRTTSDKNVLTWTYDGEYSEFILYKYFDFPEGGGLKEIASFASGETPYVLKYDEAGNPYKEYYFEDTNLAPYSEYQYAIQVERLSKTPPLSAPSALLTARTKASVGNPLMTINESDGEDNGALLVYPDRNSYLTVNVNGPDGEADFDYYSTVQYQWQKKVQGAWEDMANETDRTLVFANSGKEVEGDYRCRVNVLTKSDNTAISVYTDPVQVTHSKRTSVIENAYVRDVKGGVELYAKVSNAHTDSGAIPSGSVVFNLTHVQSGRPYQYTGTLDGTGVYTEIITSKLPAGTYNVKISYTGSKIFKSCVGDCVYLSQIEKGYSIDSLQTMTYGDGADIIFNEITTINGHAVQTSVNAKAIVLVAGEMNTITKSGGWITSDVGVKPTVPSGCTLVQPGDPVVQGRNYMIRFLESRKAEGGSVPKDWYVTFTPEFSGVIRWTEWRSPNVLIISEKDTGYLENAGTGLYKLAENTPVGNIYTIVAQSADGVSVSRKITVEPRAITLQLPTVVKKQDSGLAMGDFTYGELPVVSGTWARCDSDAEGNLTGDLASTSVNPSYTDTAGKAFNKNSMLATCGYFTIGAVDNLDNYSVTFRAGSLSVIGGNKPITFGVRPFEGEDVGTLYMVSPDYAYTREDKGITVNQAVGSRVVFTAAPDEGYQVYDWYVDGVAQGITDNRFAHVMLNQDTTVEVQFVFKPDTLVFGTVGATEGGTLTCSDSGLTSGSIVVPNTYMTFTAQAKDGYHFKEWRYTELGKGTAYFAEDEGDMSSTFNLLMPKNSCSIYAVFARDGYTLNYTDKHGVDGLTAWYWGSTSGDTTAQLEKITVASGDTVPGDTQIVIQARDGFELDEDYNFVSVGSQGTADYQNGTYTLVLIEDTDVSAYTIQHDFDVTVAFDVSKTYAFCEGMKVTLTVDGTEHIYDYTEEMTTKSVSDIPGGSKVTVTVSYPSYYSFNGWDVNGTVRTDETYTIAGLNADTVFTLKLTEDPVYKVTLADISGKGTYSVTLPEGAGQSENVVTCHENDPLTIQVIPDSGYTVTYWNVISGDAENSWETKASSLKYQFPQLTADYTFEPIFSGSTYHIVSWPTLRYYGVTLNPEEGYLATVASGNEFKFTLSGGEDSYEYVLVNGLLFYNAANMGSHYPFRYEEVGGKRIYTISNITGDQEISLSQEKPVYGVNVTPATAEVPAGKTVTLKAESYGIETDVYTWSIQTMNGTSLDVELLQRSASDTFVYEVPKNPGEQVTITIHAGNSDNETRYDIVANHVTITVTDAVDAIAVTTDDLTVQPDGSYLIHPITPDNTVGKYDLDAKVTMVSGMTNTDVTWTLWGAQMRGTSIDKNGVLTVSPKEYGTDGQMKVIATYTYPNGDTDTKETVINLSTDAYVATEVVRDIHGGVAEIGYVAGGKTVTVTATPDENHAVAVWTINGVAVADNTANELIFTAEEMTHYSVSVEFTHYYPNIEHDETNHWYECSCGDKIEVAEHYDFDKNHHCDKCDYRMSECDDADKDHFCDWCGERTSECADEVKDHICDWCGETLSVCIDEDTDHFCDWCEERVSDCADENNNHFCDYCKTKLTECKDESRDHNCDICGRELTKCGDEDKDHLCDICDLPLSECEDEDKDHNCDVCGEPNSECTDEDKNHNCDYCGKENMTECADQDPKDHICDICGETLTACADDDDDHVCDVCGEKYSDCADEEPADHFCDICGEEVSDCADADKDHACDVCGKELSTCADEDNDHNCDVCGDGLSECADEADAETGLADHYCDVCGKHLTSCVDEDTDNICDICGKELNVHDCADENRDHKCDICGKELSECADEDSDHNCDICGKTLSVCVDAADEETGLSDHNCDICGKEMSKCADAEPADHNCDICGKDLGDCVDENPADHICDVCTKELGTCADVDPEDHNCDICGIATSKCADEEPVDHKCDICDKTLTVCKDEADAETNLADHMCDICGEPVSSCADEDRNHDCDVCGKELGTCADEDNDHNCDVCNEPVSECKDEADEETGFADHICDICGEILDACKDEADEETGFADHKCDTCGKVLTQCDDTDPEDGICDICGQDMHVCVDELTDENGFCDHLCDHCGYKISECLDEETDEEGNTDHICDICGAENSLCVDEQTDDNGHKDHMCDICGEPVSECTDSDDHLCDICGEKISDCTDADHDDVCDVCGGETYAHTDEGKDHRCDVCFLPLSECDDGDNDHLCDYCGVVWSTCVDADKNHACDICGAFAGTHAETENSHICEYCGKAAGECVDNSSDHLCDICGETVSECADADPMDHMCDICGKELSTCKDEEPKDHICDICGTELSKCADEDVNEEGFRDHKCDYCGADTSVCADENKDHACDICGVTLTTCLDEVKDHLCDICGDKLSDCADENDDHKCDHCEERLSECVDGNDDHLCDLCGEPVTETADKDRDHICDICGETISDCSDSNADHICDTCGRFLGNCADEDKDHKCDVCGDPLSECADEDKNHICDYCEETLSECADEDSDHKCDICGEEISKCADEDKDHKCDICAETLSECTNEDEDHLCDLCGEPVTECVDEDKDHNCDICGEELSKCTDEDGDYVCDHCSASLGGIIRVFGANRFKTSFKVADELKQTLGVEKFSSVIIASGTNFADALSGSYLAAVKQAPMLLTLGDTMNAELHGYIEKNLVKGGTVYILGGENAVPGTLDVMMEGYHVVRLAGENRFDTNLMVLNAAGVKAGEEVLVCTSTNFADSLSASATGKPILLVWNEKGVLTEDQEAYLQTLNNCTFTVIGGENAVGSELADTIGAYGKVSRLSGKNRFETSVLVAQKYFEETESAVLAYAWDFPDGLCGGALAYAMKAPLILTMTDYEEQAAGYVQSGNVGRGVVLGGEKLISDGAARTIFQMEETEKILVK